jgi:hypothetical protein
MRNVRNRTLVAAALGLCLVLSGCHTDDGGGDVGCPACGPPPTQPPFLPGEPTCDPLNYPPNYTCPP